jgi:hypothetical protein
MMISCTPAQEVLGITAISSLYRAPHIHTAVETEAEEDIA